MAGGLPVATRGTEDVFGPSVPERRRSERAGVAYPLLDGSIVVGAFVVMGPPLAGALAAATSLRTALIPVVLTSRALALVSRRL